MTVFNLFNRLEEEQIKFEIMGKSDVMLLLAILGQPTEYTHVVISLEDERCWLIKGTSKTALREPDYELSDEVDEFNNN